MKFKDFHEAFKWGSRLTTLENGEKAVRRFNQAQIIEHLLLIISFTTLAITGLAQRYAEATWGSWLINDLAGGIDAIRLVHHLAAILFIIQSLFHLWNILVMMVVDKEIGSMWPQWKDLKNLRQMIAYNLGKTRSRPRFDRYTVEEKIEYWALVWGTIVMGVTGLIQWFPTFFTKFLPGSAIPISRAIHSWEAVLAVSAIILWHSYHTLIKERNWSIFTGKMSEHEMIENHPLEYERIIAAREIIENRIGETSADK